MWRRVGRWAPESAKPDGTYALFRVDETYLELVSDTVGSNHGTSIREMCSSHPHRSASFLIREFVSINKFQVLSSGTLGPDLSCDCVKLYPLFKLL